MNPGTLPFSGGAACVGGRVSEGCGGELWASDVTAAEEQQGINEQHESERLLLNHERHQDSWPPEEKNSI